MAYERKDGDMILFRNNKRKDDKQPVMRGELLLGGTTYEIALWGRPDRNGEPYWTGQAKVKGARVEKPKEPESEKPAFDDDIPFDSVGRGTGNAQDEDFRSALEGYPFDKDWA